MGKGAAGESSVGKERGGRWRILGINNNITYASNGVGNLYVYTGGRRSWEMYIRKRNGWKRRGVICYLQYYSAEGEKDLLHRGKSHSPMQMALPHSADRLFQCAKLPTTERPKPSHIGNRARGKYCTYPVPFALG